jgi:hypothetical protein
MIRKDWECELMRYLRILPVLTLLVAIVWAGEEIRTRVQAATNDTVPRELVKRLIDLPLSESSLLVGELPEQLPADLPLPEGAQVLGSTVSENGKNYDIFVNAKQSLEEVQAFYAERLTGAGWQERQDLAYLGGGFVPSEIERVDGLAFCKPDRELYLKGIVFDKAEPNAPTDVRLSLVTGAGAMCDPEERKVKSAPLPNLLAPPDDRLGSRGGGSDRFGYRQSHVTAKTQLDTQTLVEFYAAQLERAGWRQLESRQSDATVWSVWTHTDETGRTWQGMLFVIPNPEDSEQYTARVIAF